MKSSLSTLAGLILCTMNLHAVGSVHQEKQGDDTFATVQKGHAEAYASAYNVSAQVIYHPDTYVPLAFASNDLNPKNISRLPHDSSLFKIEKDGVYTVRWNFTVSTSSFLGSSPTVQTRLVNTASGSVYTPDPLQAQLVIDGARQAVFGGKVLRLYKGDILCLEVASNRPEPSDYPERALDVGILSISPAAIDLIKVAD